MRLRLVLFAAVVGVSFTLCHAQAPHFKQPVVAGTVMAPAINESSGLAASRTSPGVLWTHNDSGDSPRVFALSSAGELRGTYSLGGASAYDWEDMAAGPGPAPGVSYLYMGDIGDNNAVRSGGVKVYRVAEPTVPSGGPPVTATLGGVESVTLLYPDGARDAETLMVDPTNGDLYVVSKRETYSRMYRAPASQLVAGATVTMEYKASLPWGWATGGEISSDGDEILIRGYSNASLWRRPAGSDLWSALGGAAHSVPLAAEPQGEAIAFDAAGSGYYTLSERRNQPLYYYSRVGPGDANGDGYVTGGDYTIWAGNYDPAGPGTATWAMGDFTGDGYVTGADYTIWAANYTGAPPIAVPGPAAAVLLAAGWGAMIVRTKRK